MSSSKTIVITGVARRLGLAYAEHFLSKGWHVIGTYRSDRPALKSLRNEGAELHQCDFQNSGSVDAFIDRVKADYPKLRAIIHNASDWLSEGGNTSNEQVFDRMMMVHTKVPYLINLALKDALSANGEELGDIIHVTDYVAQSGSKKHLAYAASKAALESLTLSFSAAYAPVVKVNSIAPALLMFNEHDDDAYKAKALKKAALPWEGSFDAAIEAAEYLINSRYVTGRIMHLDGGRHLK